MIFAGGGSHASYFKPGDYILQIELPITKSLKRVGAALSRFWSGTLRQGAAGRGSLSVFTVPFVDYARGDGLSIGPGQAKEWTPVNLDPVPDWVTKYRGLWGLFTGDQLGGENAPAGPMYNRDGTVRQAWYDPFGFAGLDKVAAAGRGPAAPRTAAHRSGRGQRRAGARDRHEDGGAPAPE